MYVVARLFSTDEQASAAADSLRSSGFSDGQIATMSSQMLHATGASGDDVAAAVRVGKMLGAQADFYLSKLEEGQTLVVATPDRFDVERAERILDHHDPLPVMAAVSEDRYEHVESQATPLSSFFGLPVLSSGGPILSNLLGLSLTKEGTTRLSASYPPLSRDYLFSNKLGMSTKSKSDFPLSSKLGMSTLSTRNTGKSGSFGLPFKSKNPFPLSSLLGWELLSIRN